jgi:16S rRNA (guanine966-N2)-methyltransferase
MSQPVRGSSRPAPAARSSTVRIIGGRWKRTPIRIANLPGLRPTPDRVRETVFNWLAHLRPDVARLRGLDLFAGSGVLGFELASRGAAAVTLVERSQRAVQALEALQARLHADAITIMPGDAFACLNRLPRGGFDVVFLDPPYGERLLDKALAAVGMVLAPGALVYVEDSATLDEPRLHAAGFHIVRQDRAGQVNFALLSAAGD